MTPAAKHTHVGRTLLSDAFDVASVGRTPLSDAFDVDFGPLPQ